MNDLSEKVIVIMGASSGIGEATTKGSLSNDVGKEKS